MITEILKICSENHSESESAILKAAGIIKNGGLVAFPTETVYGLGADLFNVKAIDKIYEVKGRPADNPLIAHIYDTAQIQSVAKYVPPIAQKLMNAFWPGPLTLIFTKTDEVPRQATGGRDTIAVRFPQNMVARELIRFAGVPVAAPSANASSRPSPTEAAHVIQDFNGKIDMILDGGNVRFGLESTIIDVSGQNTFDEDMALEILRPGSITREMISAVTCCDIECLYENSEAAPRAPGMRYKHYAPFAKAFLVDAGSFEPKDIADKINRMAGEAYNINPSGIGILATEQTKGFYDSKKYTILIAGDRQKPESVAANLFGSLRQFDEYQGICQIREIFCEAYPEDGIGAAIMNRLKKACSGNII